METTIRKCTKSRLYTKISNAALQDERLSFKARGLISYVLSLPDDWTLCMTHLHSASPQGRECVQSAIKELKDFGYMQHVIIRDAGTGKVKAHEWIAYDDPAENPETGKPLSGLPATTKEIRNKKEIEQKEPTLGGCPTGVISGKSERAAPKPPTWEQVYAYAKNANIPNAIAIRFWKLNEYYGWRTRTSPIRNWQLALQGFTKVDGSSSQKLDGTTNTEFWAWANAEFSEDELAHANAWVAVCDKRGWKKPHKITGEMEPISDYRKACRAFVDECFAMNIFR